MGKETAKPWPLITAEELAKHKTESDCWVALHGLVLKLPEDFLNEHPGGPDVVTALAGKDVSQDYEDIAHSDSARDWASKYIVGHTEGASEEVKTATTVPSAKMVVGDGNGSKGIVPAIVIVILA